MKKRMLYVGLGLCVVALGMFAWTMTARAAYESAEYKVIETDGKIEVREYPDLMLAATNSKMDSAGRDGSFMRLFRFISGANEEKKKIAMTTPVFMEGDKGMSDVSMGFVIPKEVAIKGVPDPTGEGVKIRKREGGRFAVIRFAGRMDTKLAEKQEKVLRHWMATRGLQGEANAEAAGYDPPFTPGPMRRNEVLIRLTDTANENPEN